MIGMPEQSFPMAVRLDSSSPPLYYIGLAQPGSLSSDAVWQIMKLDTTGGATLLWANGNREFTDVWDDRLSLTYS